MKFVSVVEKMSRQSAAPGADFNGSRRVFAAGSSCDPLENRVANQKVLPELTRQVSSVKLGFKKQIA